MTCVRSVTPQLHGGSGTEVSPVEVTKYKDIIRDQDAEITLLKERLAGVQKEVEEMHSSKEQLSSQIQQLNDENTGEELVLCLDLLCICRLIIQIQIFVL